MDVLQLIEKLGNTDDKSERLNLIRENQEIIKGVGGLEKVNNELTTKISKLEEDYNNAFFKSFDDNDNYTNPNKPKEKEKTPSQIRAETITIDDLVKEMIK
jgi:hypothetical protein